MDCRAWSQALTLHGERLHGEQGFFKHATREAFTLYKYPT